LKISGSALCLNGFYFSTHFIMTILTMVGLIVLIQGFAAVVALRRKTDKVIDIAY